MIGWFVLVSLSGFSQAYDTLPYKPENYNVRLAAFRNEPPSSGGIIFLGNSITETGDWKKLLKDPTVLNRGISGDVSFGILNRLDEVIRHKPSKIFLLIGINDLSKGIPKSVIIQNIFSIVGRLHGELPKTEIFVQSILPVNPRHKNFPAGYGKENDIRETNAQLSKYSDALKYTFVDIYNQFLDNSLQLDLKFTPDGLHLNAAGYVHWVDYLKKQKFL